MISASILFTGQVPLVEDEKNSAAGEHPPWRRAYVMGGGIRHQAALALEAIHFISSENFHPTIFSDKA